MKKSLLIVAAFLIQLSAQAITEPALPNICQLSALMPDTTGYIRKTVGPTGRDYSDLQLAINNSDLGTVLILDAGATFNGNYIYPKKQRAKDGSYLFHQEWIYYPHPELG